MARFGEAIGEIFPTPHYSVLTIEIRNWVKGVCGDQHPCDRYTTRTGLLHIKSCCLPAANPPNSDASRTLKASIYLPSGAAPCTHTNDFDPVAIVCCRVEGTAVNGAVRWERLWAKIRSLVCLSVLPLADVVPGGAGHSSCFELFGFDVMVDSRLARCGVDSPAVVVVVIVGGGGGSSGGGGSGGGGGGGDVGRDRRGIVVCVVGIGDAAAAAAAAAAADLDAGYSYTLLY